MILNQLAIISDLIEKMDLKYVTNKVSLTLHEDEYNKIKKTISKKTNVTMNSVDKTFLVKIGDVNFEFNMNSV